MTSVFAGLPNDLIINIVKETHREAVKTKQQEHKKNLHDELGLYVYWKLKERLTMFDGIEHSGAMEEEEEFQPDVGCYPWLD